MGERLTERKTTKGITKVVIRPYTEMSETWQPVADKLCAFEDLMEAYGLKSIEEFQCMLQDEIDVQCILKECTKMEQDRDTWKKACELACETLKQVMGKPLWIGGSFPTPEVKDSKYFYQEAKKGDEDENN